MMLFLRHAVLLLIVVGFGAVAETPAKPACTADNAGRLWPDEANDNPKFAAALKPYDYPEVCTLERGVYGWKSPTVSVEKLRRDASKKTSNQLKTDAAKKPSGN
jgi:hypothetical protein